MSTIQSANSTPPHIDDFLKKNMQQLMKIHDEGKEESGIGCLGFKCSQKENKMDVFYMDETQMLQQLQEKSWGNLKETIENKRLFLINDLDLNSIFLVYV